MSLLEQIYKLLFTESLFKTWKHRVSSDGWMGSTWHTRHTTWVNCEDTVLRDISLSHKGERCVILLRRSLESRQSQEQEVEGQAPGAGALLGGDRALGMAVTAGQHECVWCW